MNHGNPWPLLPPSFAFGAWFRCFPTLWLGPCRSKTLLGQHPWKGQRPGVVDLWKPWVTNSKSKLGLSCRLLLAVLAIWLWVLCKFGVILGKELALANCFRGAVKCLVCICRDRALCRNLSVECHQRYQSPSWPTLSIPGDHHRPATLHLFCWVVPATDFFADRLLSCVGAKQVLGGETKTAWK